MMSAKCWDFFTPSSPLVRIWDRSTVLNSHKPPYYLFFWANPPPVRTSYMDVPQRLQKVNLFSLLCFSVSLINPPMPEASSTSSSIPFQNSLALALVLTPRKVNGASNAAAAFDQSVRQNGEMEGWVPLPSPQATPTVPNQILGYPQRTTETQIVAICRNRIFCWNPIILQRAEYRIIPTQ